MGAGIASSIQAARNSTPERSANVHGWAMRPTTWTGRPGRMVDEGLLGSLTAMISLVPSDNTTSCTTYRGRPFSSVFGRRLSKSTTGDGDVAQMNDMEDVSTGSFME